MVHRMEEDRNLFNASNVVVFHRKMYRNEVKGLPKFLMFISYPGQKWPAGRTSPTTDLTLEPSPQSDRPEVSFVNCKMSYEVPE